MARGMVFAFVLALAVAACGGEPDGGGGGAASGGGDSKESGRAPEVKVEKPPEATAAGKVAVSGHLYTHPLGYRFRYPQGWQLKPVSDDVLALVPPDAKTNAQGPMEIFLALGAPAEGMTDPGDPQIVTTVDRLVRSSFPFFSRDGEVVKGRHGGRPSAAVSWKGKSPLGDEYRATMWITILKDAALGLTEICPTDTFEKRRPMVEAVFSTFHWEAPPRDQALVGRWRHESSYISGEFSSVTVRYMGLSADGRASWGSKASMGMSHSDSAGNFTGSTSGNTGDPSTSHGRWSAANKKLYIIWDSGTEEEYEYYIEGSSMMLTPTGGGKRKVWERR